MSKKEIIRTEKIAGNSFLIFCDGNKIPIHSGEISIFRTVIDVSAHNNPDTFLRSGIIECEGWAHIPSDRRIKTGTRCKIETDDLYCDAIVTGSVKSLSAVEFKGFSISEKKETTT